MSANTATKDVHLFVLDTLSDWEPGYAIAHINRPAPGVASHYSVKTVGLSRAPIRTMGGLTVLPDLALGELVPTQSAMLILPGAEIWGDAKIDPALAKARAFIEAGVPVAAICGATFGLARAGLLDDRRHTSDAAEYLASSGYRGAQRYVNEAVVDDGGVITASAMASLEFARVILERLRVFPKAALDAWYGLYTTRDPAYFFAFTKALAGAS